MLAIGATASHILRSIGFRPLTYLKGAKCRQKEPAVKSRHRITHTNLIQNVKESAIVWSVQECLANLVLADNSKQSDTLKYKTTVFGISFGLFIFVNSKIK